MVLISGRVVYEPVANLAAVSGSLLERSPAELYPTRLAVSDFVAKEHFAEFCSPLQCDVPSLREILFHTLYLPTGLLMGRRLISLKVCASYTTTAPSISHTLARA